MAIDLNPPYEDLLFMSPLSQKRADRLIQFLAEPPAQTVLDVGCGWGELLLRVVETVPGSRGVGYDLNLASINHCRRLAAQRGLADRLDLFADDVKLCARLELDGIVCVGATQAWFEDGREQVALDYRTALISMRGRLPVGGRLVYGEAVWSVEPTHAAVAPLGGRIDEFIFLPELESLAKKCGFTVAFSEEASLDEWDAFETGYTEAYRTWLSRNPVDHPDAAEVRDLEARQRRGYFEGYRGVLGFAYLGLIASE